MLTIVVKTAALKKYVVKIVFVPMMSDNENYFEYFIPLKNPKYDDLLGNNKMQLVLKEYKMIDFFLSKKRVRRIAYYILELGVILFSMKQCFKYRCCYYNTKSDTFALAYPNAVLFATAEPEFMLHIQPV